MQQFYLNSVNFEHGNKNEIQESLIKIGNNNIHRKCKINSF